MMQGHKQQEGFVFRIKTLEVGVLLTEVGTRITVTHDCNPSCRRLLLQRPAAI
jgi:hypothetical protein